MQLAHEFTVPAPIDEVWSALLDPERVAPCMPGATLTGTDGAKFTGSVKVKLGPVSLLYKGTGEFLETDEAARKVVISASGKDSRGNGTAAATVTVTLSETGDTTKGSVDTDLNITGKPAQFGRGMITEVGGKILGSFADCLAGKLGGPEVGAPAATETATGGSDAPTSAAGPGPAAAPESSGATSQPTGTTSQPVAANNAGSKDQPAGAIDLMEYAGGSVAKRAAPVAVALALGAVLFAVLRRKRKARCDCSASGD